MEQRANKLRAAWICLILAGVSFWVYSRVLRNDFINLDDNNYVVENQHVNSGVTLENIKWAFTTNHTGYWHPVTWLSLMLDSQLFGVKPWGYHLTNLLLHIANVLILFSVLKAMTGEVWRSIFVATVFALHPLNVESVAWIAERKNVLSTMLWLLTMISYVQYVRKNSNGWYVVTLVFFVTGLMSKPMVVTLPFTLLLLDYWPLERLKSLRDWKIFGRLAAEKVPFFVLSMIVGIITFLGQKSSGAITGVSKLSVGMRADNAVVSYAKYISKSVWPTKLGILYPLDMRIGEWEVLAAGTVLALITIAVVLLWRSKFLAVGWFWYVGTLVPVIGIVQIGSQGMADRYTYVPLIGLFIMAAWGAGEILNRWAKGKIIAAVLAVLILGGLGYGSWKQLGYWRDGITISKHTIDVTKDNGMMYYNLGCSLNKLGRNQEAMDAFREVIRIAPGNANAHCNLGITYAKMGRYEEATAEFKEAIKIRQTFPEAHFNLGFAYLCMGNKDAAMKEHEILKGIDAEWANRLMGLINKK